MYQQDIVLHIQTISKPGHRTSLNKERDTKNESY